MQYVIIACVSAFLFGASTPLGKALLGSLPPFQLAGLFYIGAALGVLPFSATGRKAFGLRSIGGISDNCS